MVLSAPRSLGRLADAQPETRSQWRGRKFAATPAWRVSCSSCGRIKLGADSVRRTASWRLGELGSGEKDRRRASTMDACRPVWSNWPERESEKPLSPVRHFCHLDEWTQKKSRPLACGASAGRLLARRRPDKCFEAAEQAASRQASKLSERLDCGPKIKARARGCVASPPADWRGKCVVCMWTQTRAGSLLLLLVVIDTHTHARAHTHTRRRAGSVAAAASASGARSAAKSNDRHCQHHSSAHPHHHLSKLPPPPGNEAPEGEQVVVVGALLPRPRRGDAPAERRAESAREAKVGGGRGGGGGRSRGNNNNNKPASSRATNLVKL